MCRSAGDGEGAVQGLLAGAAAAARRSPLRSRSSPESSHSSGSSDAGTAGDAAAARAPVGHFVPGRAAAAGAGVSSAMSSFMLAPSRLPAVPSALTGPTLQHRGPVQAAPDADALIELSTLAAVDQAEPPGRLPVAAQHLQNAQQAQQSHRQLPPLSPASSPQLYRNASSSSASVESRGEASVCVHPSCAIMVQLTGISSAIGV